MAKLTPMKAIRQKCIQCSLGSAKEIKLCPVEKCALYEYRFGHRPITSNTSATEDITEEKR